MVRNFMSLLFPIFYFHEAAPSGTYGNSYRQNMRR
jgi:hypothetical protein